MILQFNESSYSDNSGGWKEQDTVYTSKPLCYLLTVNEVQFQVNISDLRLIPCNHNGDTSKFSLPMSL